jgi:hypothetical protein
VTEVQQYALTLTEGLAPTAGNIARIGAKVSPEDARWAFAQWALRERAKAKFRLAAEMLFDREALEMATHEEIAAYHASRFPPNELVIDLTTGIGADLIALAKRGPATGCELDSTRGTYAIHNLAVHGVIGEVTVADCLEVPWNSNYAFCDPARRSEGSRLRKIEDYMPNPMIVAERFRALPLGGIKLSPMLADRELEEFGGSLEFISFGSECREALIWLGSAADGPAKCATHIESRETITAEGNAVVTSNPRKFLYAADPAAIRAHCLGTLAAQFELFALADSNGYLTGDIPVESVWLRPFEVLASHSADPRRTQGELKRLGGGTPIVKSRGVKVDVEKLRRDLRGLGEELIVFVYPDGPSVKHTIARKL